MADLMYTPGATAALAGGPTTGGDLSEDNNSDYYTGVNNNRPRFPGLYVGSLTWWTTDQDVINAINSVGVNDIQEVKFFENRNNGQSKGYCVVTFASEASLPIVMEKLPKLELHGQNPVVTVNTRQNLNLFESQNKTTRPQINSNNGPTAHAAGIMGISSISGVHAGTQGLPYSGINSYNQGVAGLGAGGPRGPNAFGHTNMRMQMRGPRPGMRGVMPNAMTNGPMMSGPGGHQMNRMRFLQPQAWDNSQGGYNASGRIPQGNIDMASRLNSLMSTKEEGNVGHDLMSGGIGSQTYYTPHHPNSDHHRGSDPRDQRELREDRDNRRLDDRPSRQDDRSLRHDDRSSRHDDRSLKLEDSRSRREERSSRKEESSRRDEASSRREERSSRREEKSRRERSHRSDDRARSRSRDRSRDRKERRERRDRY